MAGARDVEVFAVVGRVAVPDGYWLAAGGFHHLRREVLDRAVDGVVQNAGDISEL